MFDVVVKPKACQSSEIARHTRGILGPHLVYDVRYSTDFSLHALEYRFQRISAVFLKTTVFLGSINPLECEPQCRKLVGYRLERSWKTIDSLSEIVETVDDFCGDVDNGDDVRRDPKCFRHGIASLVG